MLFSISADRALDVICVNATKDFAAGMMVKFVKMRFKKTLSFALAREFVQACCTIFKVCRILLQPNKEVGAERGEGRDEEEGGQEEVGEEEEEEEENEID